MDHGASPPREGAAPVPRRAGGGERAGPRPAAPPDPSPGRDAAPNGHRGFPPPCKMAAAAEPALLVTCPQGGFLSVPPGDGRRAAPSVA